MTKTGEKAPLKLAIIGVGLIGGSLGLCLKDALQDTLYITGNCRPQKSTAVSPICTAERISVNAAPLGLPPAVSVCISH